MSIRHVLQQNAFPRRAVRWVSLAVSLFAFFCVMLGWSGDAAAQSYSLRRPQTPNTWNRPDSTCPPASPTPATSRVFNIMKIRVPSAPGNQTINVTATRVSGTGIALNVFQSGFSPEPGWECVNTYAAAGSATNSVSTSFAFSNQSGFDNIFDLVVSGNSSTDTGSFTISVGGTIGYTIDCSTSHFSNSPRAGVPSAGGSFSTTFTPGPGCHNWTTSGVPAWISGVPASGAGPATINYSVSANTGAARNASIRGGAGTTGAFLSVSQLAATACSYSLGSTSTSIGAAGGARSFTVGASAGSCA